MNGAATRAVPSLRAAFLRPRVVQPWPARGQERRPRGGQERCPRGGAARQRRSTGPRGTRTAGIAGAARLRFAAACRPRCARRTGSRRDAWPVCRTGSGHRTGSGRRRHRARPGRLPGRPGAATRPAPRWHPAARSAVPRPRQPAPQAARAPLPVEVAQAPVRGGPGRAGGPARGRLRRRLRHRGVGRGNRAGVPARLAAGALRAGRGADRRLRRRGANPARRRVHRPRRQQRVLRPEPHHPARGHRGGQLQGHRRPRPVRRAVDVRRPLRADRLGRPLGRQLVARRGQPAAGGGRPAGRGDLVRPASRGRGPRRAVAAGQVVRLPDRRLPGQAEGPGRHRGRLQRPHRAGQPAGAGADPGRSACRLPVAPDAGAVPVRRAVAEAGEGGRAQLPAAGRAAVRLLRPGSGRPGRHRERDRAARGGRRLPAGHDGRAERP